MRFGLSKVNITPEVPVKLACAGNFTDNFTSVHDELYVRCMVLDDENNKALFMSFDLLFHSRDLNDAVTDYANEKYGFSPSDVIVTYTHAHTAPAVKGYNPGHHNDDYEKLLVTRSQECIDKAMSSMLEGRLAYGSYETELNVSRRRITNGVCDMLPEPLKERDTQMFVLCVRDLKDNIRGILLNYASHPVFYPHPTTLCAEFPGRVCEILDEKYGCISVYTQSAAGDVRPMPTVKTEPDGSLSWNRELGFCGIDKYAQSMCDGVISLVSSNEMKEVELSINSDAFKIKAYLDKAPKAYFENLYNELKIYPDNPITVHCSNILNGFYEVMPDSLDIHCSVIKLSDDLYVASMGGEPCNNVKKIVKSALGNKEVCFIGYTDSCAYIVDDVILEEGGYEPQSFAEYGIAGPFKKGISNKFFSEYSESLKRLK